MPAGTTKGRSPSGGFAIALWKPSPDRFSKAIPHNSLAAEAMPFPPSAACRFFDLPPVNLQNLPLHLTKNSFASAPTHLCGIALTIRWPALAGRGGSVSRRDHNPKTEKRAHLAWARTSQRRAKPIPSHSSGEGSGGEALLLEKRPLPQKPLLNHIIFLEQLFDVGAGDLL